MEIFNKTELAHYLKVNLNTICYLLYSKQLPKVRIGREYRFVKDDIDHWLKSQRQVAQRLSFKGVS